ncbi:MAG: RNA polymerase subunit sigma-24 [Acidimicrobiaceae bacterium]|nr:RNA polymerase subunit sigma-24 [Acidimicrobiaceae bacterium]
MNGREHAEVFSGQRRYLFAVAYRMLGVAEDAEDVLQDAWLRFSRVPLTDIGSPRAFLVQVVTRLSVDLLKSARRRREEYVGTWLPEPISTDEARVDELAARTESVSFAFLLLLERLTPVQRAVLVLHDVLDYTHDEVASMVGTTAAASRQALRRARRALGARRPATTTPSAVTRDLIAQFLEATRDGNLDGLLDTLAPDVVLMSDGGGKAASINRPLAGSTPVARFFKAAGGENQTAVAVLGELNGQPAVLVTEQGRLTNAFLFDTGPQGLTGIYVVRNPDKLRRLGASHRTDA